MRYHCSIVLVMLHFVKFDDFLTFPIRKSWWWNATPAEILKHCKSIWRKRVTYKTGSKECKYFIKHLRLSVSERPSDCRRWKPAPVLEFKNGMQLCWRKNIGCFTTPLHTICSSSPLDTNQVKQSRLEVSGGNYWQQEKVNIPQGSY